MRKDFDYVEFADYRRDMDAVTGDAVAVIDNLRREISEWQMKLWMVVKASGGTVSVPRGTMLSFDRAKSEIVTTRLDHDDSVEFKAR